jgi:hypothetical protein
MRLLRRIFRAKRCGRLDVIVCVAASAHESDRAACGACDVSRALGVAELQLRDDGMPNVCAALQSVAHVAASGLRPPDGTRRWAALRFGRVAAASMLSDGLESLNAML